MGLSIHPSEIPSVLRHHDIGSLWTQLLLQLTNLFETLQVFLLWSEDVHRVWGLFSFYFVSIFPLTRFQLFSGQITFRIDSLRTQLLEFSTDHFETMHNCSIWSVDVHMVWGLSSHFFL